MGVVAPEEAPNFKLCTEEGERVVQCYRKAADEREEIPVAELWSRRDLNHGVEVEGEERLKVIGEEELKEARTSKFHKNFIELTVHPIEDMGQLFPDNSRSAIMFEAGQYFKPSGEKRERWFGQETDIGSRYNPNYEILRTLLATNEVGLVAQASIRTDTSEGLYRAVLWRGHLVLQPQLFANRIYEFDALDLDVEEDAIPKVQKLAEVWSTPLDMDSYVNTREQQVLAAQAALLGSDTAAKLLKEAPVEERRDVMGALDDILATVA